jgi:hypothetical protein
MAWQRCAEDATGLGNMWTSGQFTDWLASGQCPERFRRPADPPSSDRANDSDKASDRAAALAEGAGSDRLAPPLPAPEADAGPAILDRVSSSQHPSTSPASQAAQPGAVRQHSSSGQAGADAQRAHAQRLWTRIQGRMKQQVLYTLAGAADVIDQRPRSFELFGCAASSSTLACLASS